MLVQLVARQYDVLWQGESSSITLNEFACRRPRSPRRRRLVCGFGTHVVRIGGTVQWNRVDDVECAVLIMTTPVEGTARSTLFQAWVFGGLSFQRNRSLATFSTVHRRRFNNRVELMALARGREQTMDSTTPFATKRAQYTQSIV